MTSAVRWRRRPTHVPAPGMYWKYGQSRTDWLRCLFVCLFFFLALCALDDLLLLVILCIIIVCNFSFHFFICMFPFQIQKCKTNKKDYEACGGLRLLPGYVVACNIRNPSLDKCQYTRIHFDFYHYRITLSSLLPLLPVRSHPGSWIPTRIVSWN